MVSISALLLTAPVAHEESQAGNAGQQHAQGDEGRCAGEMGKTGENDKCNENDEGQAFVLAPVQRWHQRRRRGQHATRRCRLSRIRLMLTLHLYGSSVPYHAAILATDKLWKAGSNRSNFRNCPVFL